MGWIESDAGGWVVFAREFGIYLVHECSGIHFDSALDPVCVFYYSLLFFSPLSRDCIDRR